MEFKITEKHKVWMNLGQELWETIMEAPETEHRAVIIAVFNKRIVFGKIEPGKESKKTFERILATVDQP